MVEGTDLAIDDAIRQAAAGIGDGRELFGPIEALARAHHGLAAVHPQLHAIAVELDLVNPILARGRAAHPLAQLRRHERRH